MAVGFLDSSTIIRWLSSAAVSGVCLPSPLPVSLYRRRYRLQMNLRIFNGCNRSRSLKGGWINGPWTLYRSLAQVIRSLSPLKIGYKYRKLAVQAKKKKLASLRSNMRRANKYMHGSSYKYRKTSFSKPQIKKTRLLLDQT